VTHSSERPTPRGTVANRIQANRSTPWCLTIKGDKLALWINEVVDDGMVHQVVLGAVCGLVEVHPAVKAGLKAKY